MLRQVLGGAEGTHYYIIRLLGVVCNENTKPSLHKDLEIQPLATDTAHVCQSNTLKVHTDSMMLYSLTNRHKAQKGVEAELRLNWVLYVTCSSKGCQEQQSP